MRAARAGIASIAAFFAVACSLGSAGDPPPHAGLYFPTALALSGDGSDDDAKPDYLFVANSNFDLRYSSGSVQAFDLDTVDRVIARCEREAEGCAEDRAACREACLAFDAGVDASVGDGGVAACDRCTQRDGCDEAPDAGEARDRACDGCFEACDDALDACHAEIPYDDGKCLVDPADALAGEVRVGSFATGMTPSPDGRVLFVVTRTDDHLTMVRVRGTAAKGDVLDCGSSRGECGFRSTRSDASNELPPWPGDPTDVLAGPLSDWTDAGATGDYVLVAHRRGAVSLFVEEPGGSEPRFVLAHTLLGFPRIGGSVQLTGMDRDPDTGLVYVTLIRSIGGVTGSGMVLGRVGVAVPADPREASLYDAGWLLLAGIDGETDTRAVRFVDAIEGSSAALAGPRALVVADAPTSLLVADVDPARNDPGTARVARVTQLGDGASRIVAGAIGEPGTPGSVRVAIVSCFGSREIFAVDLGTGIARSIVRNLSGPFELVLDGPRERLYVADFRSSVVRILDLAPVARAGVDGDTTARLIATLGAPRVVQELQ